MKELKWFATKVLLVLGKLTASDNPKQTTNTYNLIGNGFIDADPSGNHCNVDSGGVFSCQLSMSSTPPLSANFYIYSFSQTGTGNQIVKSALLLTFTAMVKLLGSTTNTQPAVFQVTTGPVNLENLKQNE
jgi:hypothetical protein